MGKKTRIDWCDSTWNPVTGCFHECEYCYARRIAERFGAMEEINEAVRKGTYTDRVFFVDDAEMDKFNVFYRNGSKINLGTLTGVKPEPCELNGRVWVNGKPNPYPFDFTPTFHRYRLRDLEKWHTPRTIFVCSMADLFGDWVPDEWIKQVFDACDKAPQHRYLFLTKNPQRYSELYEKDIMPRGVKAWNKYFGCTITKPTDEFFFNNLYGNGIDHPGFLSIEPIMEDFDIGEFDKDENGVKWIIVGAETGNRKGKVIPKREWIEHLVETCRKSNVPLFMKESLRGLMGDEFKQEFPWEV